MSQLTVIQDAFRGERETLDLFCGESLASNLRRHWPGGISGSWRLFRDAPHPANEIAALDLPHVVVKPFEVFVLVRGAGTGVEFWINLAISLALSAIATLLTPKTKRREQSGEDDTSGGSQLAGQSNRLRPGARVPDMLGRVRAYPDLLTAPLEWFADDGRTQQLEQYFVLGVGDYVYEQPRLGETPLSAISGAGLAQYVSDHGPMLVRPSKTSPEINALSLMEANSATLPSTSIQFIAPDTLRTVDKLEGVAVGDILRITVTLSNNGFQKLTAIPDVSQTVGPWDYTVDLTVVNETVIPQLAVYRLDQEWLRVTAQAPFWDPTSTDYELYETGGWTNATSDEPMDASGDSISLRVENGWVVETVPDTLATLRGYVRNYVPSFESGHDPPGAPAPYAAYQHQWKTHAWNDVLITPPVLGQDTADIRFYKPLGDVGSGPPPDPEEPIVPVPTDWYRAPLDDLDELWLDFSFPQGLVRYDTGIREETAVAIQIEIKRPGSSVAGATYTETYQDDTAAPLRFTWKRLAEVMSADGLPAGTGYDVRITRITHIIPDTATVQYSDETRWHRMTAVKNVTASYPGITVLQLGMTNTRSAVSLGENVFNLVVTRVLPSWDGTAFTTPHATRKWADNFVHRCMQKDGANKAPEQIDLAGIYALQDQLDALEGGSADPITGGPQGQIALTLDQMQDIDSELAAIADVVRAVVYRVGKKIYATRDQATATRIALFNGRTKNPDGEAVGIRMANDGEHDAVIVSWLDELAGYKIREYTYPDTLEPVNALRVSAFCANWPQTWRRAAYEINRIRFRREQITCSVTEDGRICRPGDVVNITDDIANLAASAGEVLYITGLTLTLDRDVAFTAGHSYSILVRDVQGQATDTIAVTAVAGAPNQVLLSRAPVTGVNIKPRDASTGTMYAFFDDTAAIVRPWLLTGVTASGPYVQLEGSNYSALVYQGDTDTLPARPALTTALVARGGIP